MNADRIDLYIANIQSLVFDMIDLERFVRQWLLRQNSGECVAVRDGRYLPYRANDSEEISCKMKGLEVHPVKFAHHPGKMASTTMRTLVSIPAGCACAMGVGSRYKCEIMFTAHSGLSAKWCLCPDCNDSLLAKGGILVFTVASRA